MTCALRLCLQRLLFLEDSRGSGFCHVLHSFKKSTKQSPLRVCLSNRDYVYINCT